MTGQTTDHEALLRQSDDVRTREDAIAEAHREIEESIARLHDLRARHVDAIVEIDTEAAMLVAAKKALPRAKRAKPTSQRTPIQKAGRGNVEKVYATLVAGGPRTQARLTETLGINNGTLTWALRALVEDGRIVATGKVVGNSKEYRAKRRRSATVADAEMALA
jgi:hypothetical protein